MGGKRLGSYRSGDRSEYLALYALSRIAFVNHAPRQEDFGIIDFVCFLTEERNKCYYAQNGFYVQVKSDYNDISFDKESAYWLSFDMDLPLIICVVDKKKNQISLYSCWNIWHGLFCRPQPDKITIKLNTSLPLKSPQFEDKGLRTLNIDIPLGYPILDIKIDDFENNVQDIHKLLKPWLEMDKMNIAYRNMGRAFLQGFDNWKPNKIPSEKPKGIYVFGPSYQDYEKAIAPILTTLAHCYRHYKRKPELEALKHMLKIVYKYLDKHGKDFADGKLKVED